VDIVITLVFSIVMLFFTAFPAIKIAEFLEKKYNLSTTNKNILALIFTITLSIGVGIFLRYF